MSAADVVRLSQEIARLREKLCRAMHYLTAAGIVVALPGEGD